MSRTFEPPWEWEPERRERAIRAAYALRSAVGAVLDAQVGQERRTPVSLVTTETNLELLKECYRWTDRGDRMASTLRVLGAEVCCHPQRMADDRMRVFSGRHKQEVYLSDLEARAHEVYVQLRKDGMGAEEAAQAALILSGAETGVEA